MSFNSEEFFNLKYLFSLNPPVFYSSTKNFLIIIFSLFVLIGIFFFIFSKIKKEQIFSKITKRLYYFFLILGVSGFILLFFREEKVYFFGSRFWLALWIIGAIIWLVFIFRYIFFKMPKIKESLEKRKEFEKYLPQKR